MKIFLFVNLSWAMWFSVFPAAVFAAGVSGAHVDFASGQVQVVSTIYENWAYLGALYHLTDHVQLGGYGALMQQFWTSTAAYTGLTGKTYVTEGDSTVIGLLAVFQFGI